MCNLSEYYEEKGYEKGAAKERFSVIERMLKRGKTPEEITAFCGYDMEEVLKVQKEVFQPA